MCVRVFFYCVTNKRKSESENGSANEELSRTTQQNLNKKKITSEILQERATDIESEKEREREGEKGKREIVLFATIYNAFACTYRLGHTFIYVALWFSYTLNHILMVFFCPVFTFTRC